MIIGEKKKKKSRLLLELLLFLGLCWELTCRKHQVCLRQTELQVSLLIRRG